MKYFIKFKEEKEPITQDVGKHLQVGDWIDLSEFFVMPEHKVSCKMKIKRRELNYGDKEIVFYV